MEVTSSASTCLSTRGAISVGIRFTVHVSLSLVRPAVLSIASTGKNDVSSKEVRMLHVRDATQVGVGIGEKVFGLSAEIAGTIFGNERLRDKGRQLGDAGTERLQAVEEAVK